MDELERLTRPDGETLALKRVWGSGPTVVWIGGFRSDMEGTKALALARPDRLAGLVLVNPAPDFTEDLMWPGLADHERQAILREGETLVVEDGLGPYVLTRRMFEEARDWLLLRGALPVSAPVHILQGRADDVVPWRRQIALVERLTGGDVRLDLIEGGDHRLSTPADLARLVDAVERNRRSSSTLS